MSAYQSDETVAGAFAALASSMVALVERHKTLRDLVVKNKLLPPSMCGLLTFLTQSQVNKIFDQIMEQDQE